MWPVAAQAEEETLLPTIQELHQNWAPPCKPVLKEPLVARSYAAVCSGRGLAQ